MNDVSILADILIMKAIDKDGKKIIKLLKIKWNFNDTKWTQMFCQG